MKTFQRPITLLLGTAVLAFIAVPRGYSAAADVPEIAGTWTWSWKDAKGQTHKHVLELEGVGAKLAAREIFDDEPPVKVDNLTLKGKDFKFNVMRDGRKAEYSGKVADADHINGTVTVTVDGQPRENEWKAERRKDAPK